jgi:Tol biopolymer transport system component
VVALGVLGGVLLTRGGSAPVAPPVALPTIAPSVAASPTPTAASLPRSAQPLANDVIVWPRLVDGNWDITTISTDGTVGAQLTNSPEEDNFPVVSPDRRTILYLHRTSPTSREVRVMGADGTGDRPLFATPPPGCTDVTRPAFNGPQLRLVLPCLDAAGATTLLLVESDGTVVSTVDRGAVGDPAMAPDGLSVVYWRAAEAGQDGGAIYWASLDGSSPPGPVTAGDDRDNDPAFSPTDNVAAFTRPGKGIWTVGLQVGNPLTQLTRGDGDMDASFSPDGTQITYKRRDEVWIMDADGGNQRRISVPGDVGTAAAWSPR